MAPTLQRIEGKYEILEKLREGGMGTVYKVRHRLLDEIQVIKVLRSQFGQDPELEARFVDEARAAIRLRHANIAQIYDFATDEDGTAFIVMEYIQGMTLEELLKRDGPPLIGIALDIAQQSLKALGYLHRQDFVHRDVSPDNLMLTTDVDAKPLVKLIDLGIAKPLLRPRGFTQTGTFLGKVHYASPEQFGGPDGHATVDARSDLYSFGIVLYELLTGRYPITGSDYSSLIAGHLLRPPLDFSVSDPQGRVPQDLRAIVLKTLAKRPEERFGSAEEFSRALARVQRNLVDTQIGPEDRTLLLTRILPPLPKSSSRPGSTQDRLDRRFDITELQPESGDTTRVSNRQTVLRPSDPEEPPATPSVTLPSEATPGTGKREIQALLSGALKLAGMRHLDVAAEQLNLALALDPENTQAKALLAEVEAQLAEERALEEERQALAHARERIAALLDADQVAEAETELARAEALTGGADACADLRARLQQRQDQLRSEEVRRRLENARQLYAGGRLDAAEEELQRAEQTSPHRSEVTTLLAEVRAAQQRLQREAERRQTAAAVKWDLASRLETADPDALARALTEAERTHGDIEHFTEIRRRIEERQREARHSGELESLHLKVQGLLAADNLDAASRALAEAGRTFTPDELALLGRQLEEALAARRSREEAERRERERLAAEEERRRQIAQLLQKAERLRSRRNHEEAIEVLEQVASLDAGGSTVAELLARTRADLQQQQEERRREVALRETAATIEALLSSGDLETAARRIAEARQGFPDAPVIRDARAKLERLRRKKLQDRIERHVKQATLLLEEGRLDQALRETGEALVLDADHARARKLQGRIQEAKARVPVPQKAGPDDRTVILPPVKPADRPRESQPAAAPTLRQEGRPRWLPAALAAAVAVAALGIFLTVRGRSTPEPVPVPSAQETAAPPQPAAPGNGMLIVEATPWGEVTGLAGSEGQQPALPAGSYTPLVLSLAPGEYTLTVSGPDGSRPVTLMARIQAGRTETVRAELAPVDLEAYFAEAGWKEAR